MQNRVSQERLELMLDEAVTLEQIFWNKELVVSYRLDSGFTILGRAACVDPDNFDIELGRKYAKEDALRQLWQLEGYRLQLALSQQIIDDSWG